MQNKVLLTVGLTLLTAATIFLSQQGIQTDDSLIKAEWTKWQLTHGKRYGYGEEAHRYQIFQSAYLFVAKHNALYAAGLESFDTELNQFADMTNEEFTARYLTLKRGGEKRAAEVYRAKGLKVPTDVDHRDSGLVSPVKDQGQCGSCWAFSAVGSLETALRLKGKETAKVELSEQEIVDCATVANGYESEGCSGGWMQDGLEYAVKNGVAINSQYPYDGKDLPCRVEKTSTRHKVSKWTQVESLVQSAFVEAASGNAISVAINASGFAFQVYRSGIYNPKGCKSGEEDLNHGVTLVGYHPTYYIVKNSWGTGWGIQGYVNFGRIDAKEGVCGIQQDGSFATA